MNLIILDSIKPQIIVLAGLKYKYFHSGFDHFQSHSKGVLS